MIKLKIVWALVSLVLLIFSGTNFYGYFKCSKEQQQNMMALGAKTVIKAAEKGASIAKNQV
jgi:hypothetical protein